MNDEVIAAPLPRSARRAMPLALLGIVLSLLAPVVYVVLLKNPLLRLTGISAFVFMIAGCLVSITAARRDRRLRVRGLAVVNCGLLVAFAYAFFIWAQMPQTPRFAELDIAPAFELPDQDERAVSLTELTASGPLLLIFYRGHW